VEERVMVTLGGRAVPRGCVGVCGRVLEVDVERAWREMGEEAGWSNEVSLEVFVG
jgi:hypothetical protein